MYLKIQAVIAKSYARIHRQNLINAGIVPLVFERPDDYERIAMLDTLALDCGKLAEGQPLTITDASGFSFTVQHHCTARELEILRAGGLLNLIKIKNQKTEA